MPISCLLVHVPKFINYYPPLHFYSSINWMTNGLFALAYALRQHGIPSRILHLGIERVQSRRFDLADGVDGEAFDAVGFSLHYHQQISDTLAEAEKLKKARPGVFVFIGGMTASFFAGDLMARYPFLDAVITGEAEAPLVSLMQALDRHPDDLSQVPNLVWRKNGGVLTNDITYSASREDLDRLSFADLPLLHHHELYRNLPKAIFDTRLPARLNLKLSQRLNKDRYNIFPGLIIGRGCYANCFYCGGCNEAQKLINHRTHVIFRSTDGVLDDMERLRSFGYAGTYISFDPHPLSQSYYLELFEQKRSRSIVFDVIFSAWGLPSEPFLQAFARAFSPRSSISISPETGSEHLRHRCREPFYSNGRLLQTLRTCEDLGIQTSIFFSLGIPHESREDFHETLALKKKIQSSFKKATVKAFVIEIEPGSPWHLHPQQYGIDLQRKTLQDFIVDQTAPDYSSMRSLGFAMPNFWACALAGEENFGPELLKEKCRYFCEQRHLCPWLKGFWRLASWTGVTRRMC